MKQVVANVPQLIIYPQNRFVLDVSLNIAQTAVNIIVLLANQTTFSQITNALIALH